VAERGFLTIRSLSKLPTTGDTDPPVPVLLLGTTGSRHISSKISKCDYNLNFIVSRNVPESRF
jgi:hypothetical protein